MFDLPTLIIHGNDNQIVPIETVGRAATPLVRGLTVKVNQDAPHGLADTRKDQLNADLLAFLSG